MKKILILILCLFMLGGCKKEETVITYKFDFINYLDIELIGPDGYADLDISISDFSARDFESESDYIAIKKLMNALYECIVASKTENISNGDIIQIGITNNFDLSFAEGIDINLNVHEITADNLPSPKTLDIFADNNVVFYGLENTNDVYYYFPNTTTLNKEMKDNINYEISIDDQNVMKDKTVLTLSYTLNSELLESNRKYQTEERYFLANGYIVNAETEKTLKTIVKETDLEKLDKSSTQDVLEGLIIDTVEGYSFSRLVNLQKSSKPFVYYVVAKFNNNDRSIYVKYTIKMAYVNKEIKIYSFERSSTVDEKYSEEALEDARIVYTYDSFELPDESIIENNDSDINGD